MTSKRKTLSDASPSTGPSAGPSVSYDKEEQRKRRKRIVWDPPAEKTCIVCRETQAFRTGVVCEHTEEAYKEHFVCFTCMQRYCQDQNVFPFKCILSECKLQYSQNETHHIQKTLSSELLSRWAQSEFQASLNKEEEAKFNDKWKCPGCNAIYWLDKDFKGDVVRCTAAKCKKAFCKNCQEPASAHHGKTCEEVKARKEALTKDGPLMEELNKQVNLVKCPNPKCVERAAIFRAHSCNQVRCPGCQENLCGNCGVSLHDPTVAEEHFCEADSPEECEKAGCKHCPRFPHTTQELEVLECGASASAVCGSKPKVEKKKSNRTFTAPPSPQHDDVDPNQRDVPEHVTDEFYAWMLSNMSAFEIARQMRMEH